MYKVHFTVHSLVQMINPYQVGQEIHKISKKVDKNCNCVIDLSFPHVSDYIGLEVLHF